ncbi:MAG: hypothetical protein IAI50_19825 [Candidatus Eremiobacteraeota bacterium]|nr:hypothetical protein [Candidatus Eremiobacteraeota bacterium]
MTAPAATLLSGENRYAGLALLAAGGELIADKLPMIPARTQLPPLIFRMVSGGLCGAAVAERRDGSRALGVVSGVAGAVATTYLAYQLRRMLTTKFRLPDAAVAVAEDALAIWAARATSASP